MIRGACFIRAADRHQVHVKMYIRVARRAVHGNKGHGKERHLPVSASHGKAARAGRVETDARFRALGKGLGLIIDDSSLSFGDAENAFGVVACFRVVGSVDAVRHIHRQLCAVIGQNPLHIDHFVLGSLQPPGGRDLLCRSIKALRDGR